MASESGTVATAGASLRLDWLLLCAFPDGRAPDQADSNVATQSQGVGIALSYRSRVGLTALGVVNLSVAILGLRLLFEVAHKL